MHETFDLPVWYNGKEIMLPAELQPWGYTHRITVQIEDIPFHFEPDEEKNYRAVIDPALKITADKIDKKILQAVAETLHDLFA